VWDMHTWTEQRTIEPIHPRVPDLTTLPPTLRACCPSHQIQRNLAAASIATDFSWDVWDARTWTRIRQFQGYSHAVQFSPMVHSSLGIWTKLFHLWIYMLSSRRARTPVATHFCTVRARHHICDHLL